MKVYELSPKDSHKSFYGKAKVKVEDNGAEVLMSYNTPVIRRCINGKLERLWSGWSATTGRHIAAFCGINKNQYEAMEVIK